MKIRAALTTGPDTPFAIEEVDLDEPRDDEVLVRLVATGICHTDLALRDWTTPEMSPRVLGHEGAGVVEAVGAAVTSVRPGDHVLISFRYCRECSECTAGHPAYCDNFDAMNFSGARMDGSTTMHRDAAAVYGSFFGQSSFATYALAYEANVVPVDSGLDLTTIAPLGCGIQTGAGAILNVLKPDGDSSLVVFGAGGVGLSAVMAAKAIEIGQIIAVDPVAGRRDTALELGATAVIDPGSEAVVDVIRELTGKGATHAFDTTGIPQVLSDGIDALARRGVLGVVAIGPPTVPVQVTDMMRAGKSLRGITEGDAKPQEFLPQLLELYSAGKLPLEKLIKTYPFDDINVAVAAAEDGSAIKPVLTF